MGLRINHNIAALNAYRNLSVTDGQMSKSLEKLSSGFRINRAADDAAGLAISEGLRSQVGGLKVAVRNTQDGISVVQTAEGALTETHSILQRMRDLSVQASNDGGLNTDAKGNIQSEISQLKSELDRIANTTTFNGKKLLDGSYNDKFQVGANAGETISVSVGTVGKGMTPPASASPASTSPPSGLRRRRAAAGEVTNAATAANGTVTITVTGTDVQSGHRHRDLDDAHRHHQLRWQELRPGLGGLQRHHHHQRHCAWPALNDGRQGCVRSGQHLNPFAGGHHHRAHVHRSDRHRRLHRRRRYRSTCNGTANARPVATATPTFTAASGPTTAIGLIDTAIKTVSTQRADLGAIQNRFDHTINNLNVAVENLTASESRIRDADMAQEMVQFTRNQILSQAGTAMLAQANQASQGVLSLLR